MQSAAASASASAAQGNLPVTSCADDGSPGTLRSVVMGATDGDTIDLGALTCGVITLEQGPIDISSAGPHPLAYLSFQGPGPAALTISGGGSSQVLVHGMSGDSAGILHIDYLRIADGYSAGAQAACIASSGDVFIDHAAIDNCHSHAFLDVVFGGAVGVMGNLVVVSSTISGSTCENDFGAALGGGAFARTSALFVESVVTSNSAISNNGGGFQYTTGGGGVFAIGDLHVVDSTINMNSATATDIAAGGGICGLRNVTIERSLVAGNMSSLIGGGISKSNDVTDPDARSRRLEIINSTVSGNSAWLTGGAGGLYAMTVENSTITENVAALAIGGAYFLGDAHSLLIHSSIIAGNSAKGTSDHAADLAGSGVPRVGTLFVAGTHNLIGSADANIVLAPDTMMSDPLLGPLADNGGPTMTHALLAGSPALDAGDNFFGFPTDQRGYARVSGPAADIGAFEQVQDLIFEDGFD